MHSSKTVLLLLLITQDARTSTLAPCVVVIATRFDQSIETRTANSATQTGYRSIILHVEVSEWCALQKADYIAV